MGEASLAECTADHQMMEFLRGARRGTASLAHRLSGPPMGGLAIIPAAAQGIAGTRAQRTTMEPERIHAAFFLCVCNIYVKIVGGNFW